MDRVIIFPFPGTERIAVKITPSIESLTISALLDEVAEQLGKSNRKEDLDRAAAARTASKKVTARVDFDPVPVSTRVSDLHYDRTPTTKSKDVLACHVYFD
jgi:hypothetical protein